MNVFVKSFFLRSLVFTVSSLSAATSFFEHPQEVRTHTTVEGRGQTYELKHALTIHAGSSLRLRNCVVTGVTSDLLQLKKGKSRLVLDNTVLILVEDFHFAQGNIDIKNMSEIRGSYTWYHTSPEALFIGKDSTLLCSKNLLYYYCPASRTKNGIRCADESSTLMLHDAHLRAGDMGLQIKTGSLTIHELCTVHADNCDPEYGITLGVERSVQNSVALVLASPRARLRVSQPHLCHHNDRRHMLWRIAAYCLVAGIGVGIGMKTVS